MLISRNWSIVMESVTSGKIRLILMSVVQKETELVSSSFLHPMHTAKTAHIRVVAPECYSNNGVSPLNGLEIMERQNESWLVVSRFKQGVSCFAQRQFFNHQTSFCL